MRYILALCSLFGYISPSRHVFAPHRKQVTTGDKKVDDSTLGVYKITYTAQDGAGNSADEKYRWVEVVDTRPPIITLINPANSSSSADMEWEYGVKWKEPGYNVEDRFQAPDTLINYVAIGYAALENYVTAAKDTVNELSPLESSVQLTYNLKDQVGTPFLLLRVCYSIAFGWEHGTLLDCYIPSSSSWFVLEG